VAVEPGCGPGRRRRQRARVQVACGEDWGGACAAPCSPADGCWRRWRSSTAGGQWECRSRSRSCLDHADQGVRAPTPRPPSVQHRRRSNRQGRIAARWRCTCAAAAAPAHPQHGPGPTRWLARSPSAPGSACSPQPPGSPPWWRRIGSITDRSRGRRLVHPSITRHSVTPQGLNHGIPKRRHGAHGLHLPSPARKGAAYATPSSHPVRQPPDCEPGENHLLRDSFVGDVGGIAVGDGRRRWGGLGVGVVVIAPGRAGAHGRVVAVGTGLGSRGVASRR